MFFKRLELNGFKSFGNKTTIDFQDGFTIVVGPNGCGKSNVLDGIKWVLGETSAKSLRGGRMGDVVFRGTQSMKPAGLSNVTLTLDNEAGLLKTDHHEVGVTRRLYANGDSQYMINKTGCRMRDVHELFLDTGLGADGYSIIEQGAVSQMVDAKPNERREIFEEAAGISRYKMRREETVRKLKRTDEDLARLEDLVSEVERQCNSLRRQARAAQRYRRMTRRLARLQQRLLVMRHTTLANQFAETEAARKEAAATFEKTAADAAKAEASVVAERERLESMQNELQQLQQKRYELRTRLDQERHRVELCNQRISNIDERVGALEKEIESRTSRLSILQQTMAAIEEDAAKEERLFGEGQAALRTQEEELEKARAEAAVATRDIQVLQNELRELRQREVTVTQDKNLASSILERLTDDFESTEFQMKELTEQVNEVETRIEQYQKRDDDLKAQVKALREEAVSIQNQIGEDDKAKKELNERLGNLSDELNQASSRLQALRELEDNYEGYFRGVREVMKLADKGEIGGIVGVVSTLLKVPKEYEVAVEVALGGDVQDIVVASVDQAKQAIAALKQRNLGRATFLPLDFLHWEFSTKHLQGIWNTPGVLGLGRDLVGFDEDIKRAVYYLFGNTVFVEQLDIAVELERNGIRNRFVSLQGDVVNPRGVLSGGSHQTRGLLSRQREIRQLQDRVKTLEGDFQRLHDEMAATKDRLGQLYARAAEVQSEIHRLEKDETAAAKDLQQADQERREKRNRLASVEARLSQQRTERVRQAEIIEKSTESLTLLESQISETTEKLAAREDGASDLLKRQQELSESVAVSRESQRGLSERVAAVRMRLDEMKQSMEESKADQSAREEERLSLAQDREQALLDRDDAEQVVGDLARQFEETNNAANGKAQELEAESVELRRRESETQKLQRDKNERDNVLRELEMKATELRTQVEYVEREAEDEFALTMDEVRTELEAAEAKDREWREEQEAAKAATKEAPKPEAEEPKEEQPSTETSEIEDEQTADSASEAESDADENEEDALDAYEPATTPEDDEITDHAQLRSIVVEIRQKLSRMGAVNEAAIEEYAEQKERFDFLINQRDDVLEAKAQLEEAIQRIDETTTKLFNDAMENIRSNFTRMFQRLFNGGEAELVLVEDERYPEPGIDIQVSPPGKKLRGSITLLSGGEKCMTAIALMFALFQYRPSPICILDEIDAPLDDVNCTRLCDALREFAADTQFLIITHNKITMGLADTIYGVTMQEPGVSKVVSVKFEEVEEQGLLEQTGAG